MRTARSLTVSRSICCGMHAPPATQASPAMHTPRLPRTQAPHDLHDNFNHQIAKERCYWWMSIRLIKSPPPPPISTSQN